MRNKVEYSIDSDGDPITNIWLDGKHSRLQGMYIQEGAFNIIKLMRKIASKVKYIQQ